MSKTAEELRDELLNSTDYPSEVINWALWWFDECQAQARNYALEEAAAIVDQSGYKSTGVPAYDFIAAAIRRLKKGG